MMSNFVEAFLPDYYFFRLIGLAPFSFDRTVKNVKFQVTFLDIIISFCIISVHLIAIWLLILLTPMFQSVKDTKFMSVSWQFCYFYSVIIKILCISIGLLKRKDIVRFLMIIRDFDKNVWKFNLLKFQF
jgi:hypothetical protein